jgi:hypothetical protein
MEKEFVPYELALRMKQLGFDEPCFGRYIYDGLDEVWFLVQTQQKKSSSVIFEGDRSVDGIRTSAPLYQQSFRWFREKHGYWSYIKEATKGTCRFYIEKFDEKFFNSDIIDSYEEAELACLEKLIEIAEQYKS